MKKRRSLHVYGILLGLVSLKPLAATERTEKALSIRPLSMSFMHGMHCHTHAKTQGMTADKALSIEPLQMVFMRSERYRRYGMAKQYWASGRKVDNTSVRSLFLYNLPRTSIEVKAMPALEIFGIQHEYSKQRKRVLIFSGVPALRQIRLPAGYFRKLDRLVGRHQAEEDLAFFRAYPCIKDVVYNEAYHSVTLYLHYSPQQGFWLLPTGLWEKKGSVELREETPADVAPRMSIASGQCT